MDEDHDRDCDPIALSRAAVCALAAIGESSFEQDEVLLWVLISAAWPSWRALSQ